jgi:hypothetical protein
MIPLHLNVGNGYQCHWVIDANFAVGDQKFIGYPTNTNNVS